MEGRRGKVSKVRRKETKDERRKGEGGRREVMNEWK